MLKAITHPLRDRISEAAMERLRRLAPVGAFTGGFTWDSFTLTRVDNILDISILFCYLVLLGTSIVLMHLAGEGKLKPGLMRMSGWYPNMEQFFMGGLFSSYVVFYFHSASMTRTMLFVILLFILLVSNELLKDRLRNIYLTMGLYFFVAFAFFTFSIPVLARKMNYLTFMASGMASLLAVAVITHILSRALVLKRRQQVRTILSQSVLILIALSILYAMNWIPPVPLSVKQSGIYHDVQKDNGRYLLQWEKPEWYQFWRTSDTVFSLREGDTVYCFSSVFAPSELKKRIYHHWQKYSDKKRQWVEMDRLGFRITGGRGKGWRGYSNKQHVSPGRWRVEIRTEEGLMLGRISFRIRKSLQQDLTFVTDSI